MTRLSQKNWNQQKSQSNDAITQLSPANSLADILNTLRKDDAATLWQLFDVLIIEDKNTFSDQDFNEIKKCIVTVLTFLKELLPQCKNIINMLIDDVKTIDEAQKQIIAQNIKQLKGSVSFNAATPVSVLMWFFEVKKTSQNSSILDDIEDLIQNQNLNKDDLLSRLKNIFENNNIDIVIEDNQKKISEIKLAQAIKLQTTPYDPKLIIAPQQGYSAVVLPNTYPKLGGEVQDRIITQSIANLVIKPEIVSKGMEKAIATMAEEILSTQTEAIKEKKENIYAQGATFNGAFIHRDESNNISVCFANLGDSCAFHINKNDAGQWQVNIVTDPLHRLPPEELNSPWRGLAVTRSFGDKKFIQDESFYTPDIISTQYENHADIHPGYLLLVTDGVHDGVKIDEMNELTGQCGEDILGKLPCQILKSVKNNYVKKVRDAQKTRKQHFRDDAAMVLVDLSKAQGFFGVDDGHGGQQSGCRDGQYVSSRVAEQLPNNLFSELSLLQENNIEINVDQENIIEINFPDLIPCYRDDGVLGSLRKFGYEKAIEDFLHYKSTWCLQFDEIGNKNLTEFEKNQAKLALYGAIQIEIKKLTASVKQLANNEISTLNGESKQLARARKEAHRITEITNKIELITEINKNYRSLSHHIQQQIDPGKNPEFTGLKLSQELDSLCDSAQLACYIYDRKKEDTIKKAEIIKYHNKYFKTPDGQEYIKNENGLVCSPLIIAKENEKKELNRKLLWSAARFVGISVAAVVAAPFCPLVAAAIFTFGFLANGAGSSLSFKKKPLTSAEQGNDAASLIAALPSILVR